MNKFILEQLRKTKIKLPEYNENTTKLIIPKFGGKINNEDIIVGHVYLLYLEDYIINEPEGFTLSSNWNNGTKPVDHKVNAKIMQIMGKMVKINSLGLESNLVWDGWVPRKGITVVEEINV